MVWVPAGDHRVPGTLAVPGGPTAAAIPVVLLLHGDLSNRNENGDLFTRLAADLATEGVASLRIDFAGSGDSEEPDLALDYPGMVTDAAASVDYLRADPRFDPAQGRGAGAVPRWGDRGHPGRDGARGGGRWCEWSGAVYNGYDEDPEGHDQARTDGYVTVGGGSRLSLNWFDSIEESHPLDDVAGFTGPVLAVTGSDDGVVPPEVSDLLLQTVASTDTTRHSIDGADHEYDATTGDHSSRSGSPDGDHRLARRTSSVPRRHRRLRHESPGHGTRPAVPGRFNPAADQLRGTFVGTFRFAQCKAMTTQSSLFGHAADSGLPGRAGPRMVF